MNDKDLGKRAKALPFFEWAPGMLVLPQHEYDCSEHLQNQKMHDVYDDDVPNLSDPATLGVFIAQVRADIDFDDVPYVHPERGGWWAGLVGENTIRAQSEAAAWVEIAEWWVRYND